MKKLMSLMLGLSLIVGAATMFAQDAPKDEKKAGKKKGGKKKKTDDTKKS